MSYRNPRDPFSNPTALYMDKGTSDLKIAYTRDFDLFEVDKEVIDVFDQTIELLKEKGFDLQEVHFNFKHNAAQLSEQWCKGITIDCALDINHEKEKGNDLLKDHAEDFPEEFIYWKNECDKLTIEDMYKFNLARTDVLDQFENIFENYDLILSPVSCSKGVLNKDDRNTKGPETINGKPVDGLIGWAETYLANFTGNPAASIPAGFTEENIPVGLQIIGRRYDDSTLLSFAKEYELINPWLYKGKLAF